MASLNSQLKTDYITQAVRNAQAEAIRNAKTSVATPETIKNETASILQNTVKKKDVRKTNNLGVVVRANAKEDTRTAEQKMNAAQKALNIHNAAQGENKPVEKSPLQKAMDDLFRQPAGTSVSDAPVQMDKNLQQPDQDARRKELEATVEHYRQQMQAEEDRAVMDADMAEFNSWPEEDREALKTYIIQDAQEKNNPFSTPSLYSARYNATNLFNKYGAQKVKEMAESYRRSENEKSAQEVAQIGRENTGVLSNAATVGLNLVGNLASPLGYLQETTERTGRYSTMDANNAGNLFNTYSGAVRQQTAQNIAGDVYDENGNQIQEGGMGRQLLSYGYQTLMSAADSIARAAVGGGVGGKAGKAISLGLAGLGSWGQTMSQASAQGATPTQAAILATANAGIEVATEFIPLDELLKTAKGGVGKIMPVLIATMKQAGIEATTEEISLLGTLIAEAAFLQEKSSYAQTINALVANGATIEEATAQADAQVWQEVKDTAIISAGSGGMSGFGSGLKGVKAQAQQTVDAMEAQKAAQTAEGAEAAKTQPELENQAQPQAEAAAQPVTQEKSIVDETGEYIAKNMPKTEPAPGNERQSVLDKSVSEVLNNVSQKMQTAENGASNRMAEEVMNDPAALQQLIEKTGAEIAGTKAEQRMAVKDALNQMFASEQTSDLETVAEPQPDVNNNLPKGTGAAEQNFTGKAAYQDLLYEGNVQRDRPTDVRPMEVPKTNRDGRNVSESAGNLYGAKITPDHMANAIESLINDDKLSYDVRTNRQSLENAAESISTEGADEIKRKISENVSAGVISDGDIEKGILLYGMYASDPSRQDEASSVVLDIQQLATMSGRNLQLFSLIRRMTPEGQLMAIQKGVNRAVENMNKGRNKKNKVGAKYADKNTTETAANVVTEARQQSEKNVKNISDKVRYKKGKVTIDWNQNGEPFLFEYAQKVGESLADKMRKTAAREESKKPDQRTTMQIITDRLKKFADEKVTRKNLPKKKPVTNIELLKDYIQYQDLYLQAWETAQYELQDEYANNPYISGFVNSGIGVDASNNPKNKIFARAIASAALDTKETKAMIKKQADLGVGNVSDRIAENLILQTEATGEMADTIRDAARAYVDSVLNEEQDTKKTATERTQGEIRSAISDEGYTLSQIAKSTKEEKESAKSKIFQNLAQKYGFAGADLSRMVDNVFNEFDRMSEAQSGKILDQQFGEKTKAKQKNAGEIFTELENLGAFDEKSKYKQQATEKVIKQAAKESGESEKKIQTQNALGFKNMEAAISEKIISESKATGARAEAIKDAVSQYVDNIINKSGENLSNDEIVERAIRSALGDISNTLTKIAKTGSGESVKPQIVKILTEKYGFEQADASQVATVVGEQFEKMVKGQAEKILDQKFTPRQKAEKKKAAQILTEFANLGAFDIGSRYNQQATARVFGRDYGVTIDADLAKQYKNAKTEAEKQQIMDSIFAEAASRIPATLEDKWNAWRYMAMLGNAKTQVRNIAGNAAFMPYKEVKDKMAAAAERVFLPQEKRTKSLTTDRELVEWAKRDAKSEYVQNSLKYSAKLGDDVTDAKIQENVKVFDNKALESVRKFVEKLPAGADLLFKNGYYERSLAGFLSARGYTASDMVNGKVSDAILNEGRSYAIQEAMKATFNDSNSFSDFFAGLRYKGENPVGKAANLIAEGVLPFRRTPANIVVRFTEYSPVGLAKGAWDMATKVRNGDLSAAAAIDQIASGMTGTAALALGYFLASGIAGVKLTGSGNDEDEKRQGHQDYALEFSVDGQEYSYKIDWAAPANLPLFVGANIHNAIENAGGDADVSKLTSFVRGFATMFEPMLALSCLSSLNDLVEGVRYAEDGEALYTLAADAATSYLTQAIPALARQAAQAIPENKQMTFVNDEDPTIKDLKQTAANIPGVGAAFQTDRINAWGEKESQGNWMERAFNSFVNPGTLKKIDSGELEKEISRLNKLPGVNVSPPTAGKKISYTDTDGEKHERPLTEEEYQTLATTQGQTAKAMIGQMIKSKDYQTMDDDQKAKAIEQVYSYAKTYAETKAIEDHTGFDESWMMEIDEPTSEQAVKKGTDYIMRRVTKSELTNTFTALDTAWDKGYKDSGRADDLKWAYDVFAAMTPAAKADVKEWLSGDSAKYVEAREKGVTHEQFLSAAKNVNAAKGTGKGGAIKDIDKRQAIAETDGIPDAVIDKIMKAYMGDYDPDDSSSEKTELKYDYIRHGMGLSPEQYAETYRAYLDNDKKAEKVAAIMDLGYSRSVATTLYNVYYGNTAGKNAYMKFYENSR